MEVYKEKGRKRILIFGIFAVVVLISAPVLLILGNWQWSIIATLSGISFILLTVGLYTEFPNKSMRYLDAGVFFWILDVTACIILYIWF